MVIKVKKHLFFKPRRCPDCGKLCFTCRNWRSLRCKECHKDHARRRKYVRTRKQRKTGNYKYCRAYKRRRTKVIAEHPYCALCGGVDNLTTHHVGGGDTYLTVLCDECHQAYERYNNKRKAKLWKKNSKEKTKKRLTVGSRLWRSIMRLVQSHYLMCYYQTQLAPVLERAEAQWGALSYQRANITG